MENVMELNKVYSIAFYRILREIRFQQLRIYFKDQNDDLVCVSDVTIYIFMAFNSTELINEGYLWSEETENIISTIISHIAWLFARDLAIRSHQSTGAKNSKQFVDPEDPNNQHIKPTNTNFFSNS